MNDMSPGFVPYMNVTSSSDRFQQGGLPRSILTHEEDYRLSECQFYRFSENWNVERIETVCRVIFAVNSYFNKMHDNFSISKGSRLVATYCSLYGCSAYGVLKLLGLSRGLRSPELVDITAVRTFFLISP